MPGLSITTALTPIPFGADHGGADREQEQSTVHNGTPQRQRGVTGYGWGGGASTSQLVVSPRWLHLAIINLAGLGLLSRLRRVGSKSLNECRISPAIWQMTATLGLGVTPHSPADFARKQNHHCDIPKEEDHTHGVRRNGRNNDRDERDHDEGCNAGIASDDGVMVGQF